MFYLILAIASSALVSVIMRLSDRKVTGNIAMLAVNYLMCVAVSAAYAGGNLIPDAPGLTGAVLMGAVNGLLYLGGFVLLQINVRRNGVVLSSTFMKLGLLVSIAVSVVVFREMPDLLQIIGFCLAVAAILLINLRKDAGNSTADFKLGLILMLLAGGMADAMSKIFEELGNPALEPQFLAYTFLVALILCSVLMRRKGQRPGKWELIFGLLIGVPNFFSAKFLLGALENIPAVIVYPVYSVATILVVTLTGVLAFKERLEKRQWIGMGLILVALVLLNV
jgi:drug/metabolite transporter (DMT)-like permease